ncbi:MAG TPA: hypothetical protein VKA67_13835, partial [Verrucomicrobiae bacterium]|nr:hypothetical protein [Verrucomicrobiae bacterium]
QILYDVKIPPNSSATLELPVPPQDVRESSRPLRLPDASTIKLTLAAGIYHFLLPKESAK